ncbi:MAG: peptidoglycan synthetase [Cyclobacteriaceae bacterium]|nr:peptidoglycan synthetase [Cyclobacteriaceae bacterium]
MQKNKLNIHLIAMGGSVMHALALALKTQGHTITGSDDQFFDPSKSALKNAGILPEQTGWDPDKITNSLNMVILGMHAQKDNPELLKAQELNVPVYSFPEFIYQQSQNKQRIVIAGSHGKTTITSMIMHVLKYHKKSFDYVVGADVKGFESRIRLSDAPMIVIEGDEYLSSRIDATPKMLRYQHHIGVVSGIAWDHINVFKTEKEYIDQFKQFANATPKAGTIAYNQEDTIANEIGSQEREDVVRLPFNALPAKVKNGTTYLETSDGEIALKVFGKHNLINMAAAKEVVSRFSINDNEFYEAIASFELPSLRLQTLIKKDGLTVYRDYAHAPSKVKATVNAVTEHENNREVTAILELHTYSSLNKAFLPHYKGSLDGAGKAIVFFDPEAIALKKLEPISEKDVLDAFGNSKIKVVNSAEALSNELKNANTSNATILLMSSGNFGGLDLKSLFI